MQSQKRRMTIGRSMVLLAGVAFVMGLARYVVDNWQDESVVTIVAVLLTVVGLSCLVPVPRGRSFRAGFAIAGWAYLGLAFLSPVANDLPTGRVIRWVWEHTEAGRRPSTLSASHFFLGGPCGHALFLLEKAAITTGHAIFGLLFGLCGGCVGFFRYPGTPVLEPEPDPFDGRFLKS